MRPFFLYLFVSALSLTSPSVEADPYCNPGPWGKVKISNVFLEAPESIVRLIPAPSEQTVWRFPEMSFKEVTALLDSIVIDADIRTLLREETPLQTNEDETRAFPSLRVIRSLPLENRQKLYRFLSGFEENPYHYNPIIIDTDEIRDWFPRDRMPEEALSLIEELSVPIENALAFADVPSLLPLANSENEELQMRKALTRSRSMLLSLEMTPDTNWEELTEYWTVGGSFIGAVPFLESLQRTDEDLTVGLTEILPLTPRRYLNSFPVSAEGITGSFPNNYWTTFNFFRITPDPKFLRRNASLQYLRKYYDVVEKPLKFGDIVALSDPDRDQIAHVCNFVADDIVYTKNGTSLLEPWIFMKIEDLLSRFSIRKPLEIQYWRRKPVPAQSLDNASN